MEEPGDRERGECPGPFRGSNRLSREVSPYLRQHACDPVDWYPWGEEAFSRARKEDKPVFLSIGYATCHWCHVMHRESFSDPEVARALNGSFVCIKLDREERPDLDQYFMDACIAFTGRGGWPLSLFLTPEKVPFFATSYIPRKRMGGSYGILEVLSAISAYWREHRGDAVSFSREISVALARLREHERGGDLPEGSFDRVFASISSLHDPENGGFGPPPRFPMIPVHLFLLRYAKVTGRAEPLSLSCNTLLSMSRGGVYDHLGGGFHRYATDAGWLVPHFEKMLYDQALAALAFSEAYVLEGDSTLAGVARECMEYICRDLAAPEGGFYAGEDADSGGKEGLFYLWTWEEIDSLLDPDERTVASRVFAIDGRSRGEAGTAAERDRAGVLSIRKGGTKTESIPGMDKERLERVLSSLRQKLFRARAARPRPPRDTLVLADWNGLAVSALAVSARVLGDPAFLRSAERCARFLLGPMRSPDGGLFHRWKDGEAGIPGMSPDFASVIAGLLDLYLASRNPGYLSAAIDLEDYHLQNFWDPEKGGYFWTRKDQQDVLCRTKEFLDGAVPSANALSFSNLVRLHALTGEGGYRDRALQIRGFYAALVDRYPLSCGMFLAAELVARGPTGTVVVAGEKDDPVYTAMMELLDRNYTPFILPVGLPAGPEGDAVARMLPWTSALAVKDKNTRAYPCTGQSCQLPVGDPGSLGAFLKGFAPGQ